MTGMTQQPEFQEIPDAIIERRKRRSAQLIWIIPVIAALIGITLTVKTYMNRGEIITISFKSGEGIEVGKTKIKFKDVQIGEVKAITIAKDRSQVLVTAEMFKGTDELLVEDTRFWVVRPRIAGNSVSGLGTLLDGPFISVDAGTSKKNQNNFVGLERPPVVTMNAPGRQFVLRATDIGSLDISSPIYYRRIQAGEVVAYEMDKDGKGITLKIFVRSPYDQYVKSNTMFWHASGIDLTFDANGLKVNTESMVTVLLGGIAFQSQDDSLDAPPALPNSVFTLFANKEEAMRRPDKLVEKYTLIFRESVRGLTLRAPVDLRGVTVGEVTQIGVELDPKNKKFEMPVEIQFYPERLRAHYHNKKQQAKPMDSRKLLDSLVEHGFRAQLRSGSLLTGQLYVALDFFPKPPPAKIDWSKNPPEFPTLIGSMEQFQATIMQIVQKIEKIPLEELTGDAHKTIKTLDATLKSADNLLKNLDTSVAPELRKTLEDVQKTLGAAKQTLSADAPLQQELRETLRELGRAAQSLRVLSDYLERNPESLIRGKKEDER